MRLFVSLIFALMLSGCMGTGEIMGHDFSYSPRGVSPIGGGNVQVRSGLPFEVCSYMNDGYREDSCTMLGNPGVVHSSVLRYTSTPAHTVWYRFENEER